MGETEMCIKLSNLPNGGISSFSSVGYESLSGMGGSGCMEHRHEMRELMSENNKLCFSKIPLLTCKRQCHSVGMREKRIGFTCMPEYDRKTQHIAEKVRRGETVPELRNLPTTFTKMRSMRRLQAQHRLRQLPHLNRSTKQQICLLDVPLSCSWQFHHPNRISRNHIPSSQTTYITFGILNSKLLFT